MPNSAERVDDPNAAVVLAVAEVLGQDVRAAQRTGCLDDRGIAASARHIMEVTAQTIVEGRGATRALLTVHPNLTAIYCTTDTLAIGALCECRVLGLRVPEDVSNRN